MIIRKIFDIKRKMEEYEIIKEDYLFQKAKLMMIQDKVIEGLKDDRNVFSCFRDIKNIMYLDKIGGE